MPPKSDPNTVGDRFLEEIDIRKLVGYARISTEGQDLKLQLDALEKVGCLKSNLSYVTGI